MQDLTMHYADHRPLIHYSVPEGWMNDPNGLVYAGGFYHLFYQHYPCGLKHGPMHWGHARSKDLMEWEQLPIALYPDDLGVIYSGSAIVDDRNVSGLGTGDNPPVLAFFTHHRDKGVEYQSMAYSRDGGMHFEKYPRNPVVVKNEVRNFRDPKVIWHEESGAYIMVIAAGREIMFYRSENLLEWACSGTFAGGNLPHGGVFECPDLVRFAGGGGSNWALLFSLTGTPDDDWRMGYLTGSFDGKTFLPDDANKAFRVLDDGIDNYADVTFSGVQEGRTILLGWMNYWGYGDRIPAAGFRGSMTIPRTLSLVDTINGPRLAQWPVQELFEKYPARKTIRGPKKGSLSLPLQAVPFSVSLAAAARDFRIVFHNDTDLLTLSFNAGERNIRCDRSRCGITGFSPKFGQVLESQVESLEDEIDLLMVVDVTSIELFACGGKNAMTVQFFTQKPFTNMVLNDGGILKELKLFCRKPI